MSVELILLEDVKSLGNLGDRVRVADGYARNYLLPRKLAAPVTAQALRELEARKLALQKEHARRVAVAQAMAEKISRASLTLPMEATEDDKLYGSVTEQHIVEALAENGIQIDRGDIRMEDHIRQLGVYNIDIQLHDEVRTAVKVWVIRK